MPHSFNVDVSESPKVVFSSDKYLGLSVEEINKLFEGVKIECTNDPEDVFTGHVWTNIEFETSEANPYPHSSLMMDYGGDEIEALSVNLYNGESDIKVGTEWESPLSFLISKA